MRLKTQATLANGGEAVARDADGRVVFIHGAAPNELVEIEIIESKKSFRRAKVSKIIEPSPDRVEPKCRYVDSCGGCVSQHVAASAQTQSKQDALIQTLQRIGKLDLDSVHFESPWSGDAYGYRSRARLALAPGKVVGFRAAKSKDVVDVQDCPILTPQAQQALLDVRQLKLQSRKIEEFDIVSNDDRAIVRLPKKFARSLSQRQQTSRTEYIFGESRKAIPANDGHGKLMLSPGVFAQSNAQGNVAMIDYLKSLIGSVEHLIELYAGSGNFSRALKHHASRLEIVEGEGPAIDLAKRILPPEIEIHQGSVEAVLEQRIRSGLQGVTVVADPPRSGFSPKAVELLRALRPKSLIYVSCDPVTFARDLGLLRDLYGLTELRLFDLYPHTAHAEVIGMLKPI